MITRTQHGYALGSWEGIPTQLPNGSKLTPCEVRAAVCRMSGLSQAEAAQEMHCSKSNVGQAWGSIYYKLRMQTGDVVIALHRLMDLGVLRRLLALLLVINACGYSADVYRPARVRGGPRQTASARRAGGRTSSGNGHGIPCTLIHQLDQITGAGDCYSAADGAPVTFTTLAHAWRAAA